MKRAHLVAVAALVMVVLPTTTGCWNGLGATTTTQASMNSGNGVEVTQGPIHVENTTLVLGPEGSTSATLLVRIVNTGVTPDRLTYATINGAQVTIPEAAQDLAPGASVSFGYDSTNFLNTYELDVAPSAYVPVQLGFADAGLVGMSVLTVPPTGYYEGIAPTPPSPPAAPAA